MEMTAAFSGLIRAVADFPGVTQYCAVVSKRP
jgi:hypothetical protein